MDARATLIGTHIRRIDALADGFLALTLHGEGIRGVLLIGLASGARGIGWIDRRPTGRPAGTFALQCKHHLEGARIANATWSNEAARLDLERGGQHLTLVCDLRGAHGDARLYEGSDALIAALRARPASDSDSDSDSDSGSDANAVSASLLDWPLLHSEGARLLAARDALLLDRRRHELTRALRAEARREQRKLTAIESDLQRAAEVPALRHHASLVLSNLHALAADAVEADLLDYASDPPQSLALRFDPKLGPKRQAEAWFNRARKLERGAAIAADRASASRSRLAVLHALAERAQAATDAAALDAVAHQAQPFGIAAAGGAATAEQPATTRAQPSARLPYREFVGSGGRPILVGRGAADNDRLTLDHARPHDLWLHARDESGAHVVVPLKRDEACPPELLCDAATLTAHFSQARGQSRADVVYTQRRYVRKPRKAATGSVQLMREKVFALRLEPARLARLLAAEKHRRP